MVFNIIGLFLENSNNSGILGEIKKLINGEQNANERYTILGENQSYIDNDGERQGFKVNNPDGSTSFAIDTDNDGKPDHLTTYDKTGKVKSEKPLVKKRTKGTTASTTLSSQVAKGFSKPSTQSFNFYSDCITTLDVKGFKRVCSAWEKPDHEYLYIIGATIIDCGESDWNWFSPTADIGMRVRKNNANGKNLLPDEGKGRLFGPYYDGLDDDGSKKYEWLDYCSMRYNNFAIADLTDNPCDKVYILGQEGDDWEVGQGPDDNIFIATVSLDEIRRGNIVVTGTCDILGKCATLYFAIGKYNDTQGKFWNNSLPSQVPSKSSKVGGSIGKGILTAPAHPVRTAKDVGKAAAFISDVTIHYIREGANYVWNGPKKLWGAMNKKWVAIVYSDGYCIFNHVRSYRTIDDIINTATGNGGDCDWWPWPEGSSHVCLDSKKNAEKLVKKHGRIKDIYWIDHPTKHCGK